MKDIAVYTETFANWPTHVKYAFNAAVALGANVTGVCVCPAPDMGFPSYDAPGVTLELIDQIRQLMDDAFAVTPSFVAEAQQLGAKDAAWQVAQGYVPDCLALIANWHDLLVLQRSSTAPWGSPSALGHIMLSCGIPCLIVPENRGPDFSTQHVAIAWDGSAGALRAVHAALPLLARAARVTVLDNLHHQPSFLEHWRPGFELFGYLQRHGIAAQPGSIGEYGKGIGSDLLQSAETIGADLLVMGCYGHTRLREWVLGGATREVLEQATIPVLMVH